MKRCSNGRRCLPRGVRPRTAHLLLLSIAVAVGACSPRRAAEFLLLGDHFELARDLAFGDSARQRLDVYRPLESRGPSPVVVFLYGGRWQSGSREDYRLLGNALTRRGWVAVVPDYRLYPEARFPAWVDDAADAVAWTRRNVGRFGGDPDRLFVVGHSAGAHTAALLALDPRFLARAGVPPGAVRGFVSIAGPVDTVWTDPDVQTLMGPRQGWPATYPSTHVGGAAPPLLLLHGGADETVLADNSLRLAERIRQRGGCARAVVYPGVGHVEIMVALAVPELRLAPALQDLAAFVRDPVATACAPSGGIPGRAVR